MLELHYDNPDLLEGNELPAVMLGKARQLTPELLSLSLSLSLSLNVGIVDSSGFELVYTSIPPEKSAGILGIGQLPLPSMIVPPNVENFVVPVSITPQCTDKVSGFHMSLYHNHTITPTYMFMYRYDYYRVFDCSLMCDYNHDPLHSIVYTFSVVIVCMTTKCS